MGEVRGGGEMEAKVSSICSAEDSIRGREQTPQKMLRCGHPSHDLSRKILVFNLYLHAEEADRGTSLSD